MKRPNYVTQQALQQFITQALAEDLGNGDHSSLASIPSTLQHRARLIIKEDCVLAGIALAQEIFYHYDKNLQLDILKQDGDWVTKGTVALVVSGKAQAILATERLVLNCLQRMSGIATQARQMATLLAHTKTKILDTRKTTPNFRLCEKWAVYIGGGQNHRFGLYDMIMLKDNHIDYAGGITQAVAATVAYLKANKLDLKIEVETRHIAEVQEALNTGHVDVIMLDNMSINEMKQAVAFIDGRIPTEASGTITKATLQEVAATGVDFISSGSIIYGALLKDMSLKAF